LNQLDKDLERTNAELETAHAKLEEAKKQENEVFILKFL
jgi:hypothetical protein